MAAEPEPQLFESGKIAVTRDEDGNKYIGEYKIIKTLGRGCFGKVKEVQRVSDGKTLAIKILNKSLLKKRRPGMPDMLGAVMREIAIMKKIDHPHCCRLYEAWDDAENNQIFLVIEYISGGTVADALAKAVDNRLEVARAYFRDLVTVHHQNIVHRDLKPENLLIDAETGIVKLADFGVSQICAADEKIKLTAGTPAFMAPEMCAVGAYSGPPTDVWSCGVCLYFFVFDKLPFTGNHMAEIYRTIINDPLVFPTEPEPLLKELLLGLLDKNPETRFTIQQAQAHPWVTKDGEAPLEVTSKMEQLKVDAAEVEEALTPMDKMKLAVGTRLAIHKIAQRKKSATTL